MDLETKLTQAILAHLAPAIPLGIPLEAWDSGDTIETLPRVSVKVQRGQELVYRTNVHRCTVEVMAWSKPRNIEGGLTAQELKEIAEKSLLEDFCAHEKISGPTLKVWSLEDGTTSDGNEGANRKCTLSFTAVALSINFGATQASSARPGSGGQIIVMMTDNIRSIDEILITNDNGPLVDILPPSDLMQANVDYVNDPVNNLGYCSCVLQIDHTFILTLNNSTDGFLRTMEMNYHYDAGDSTGSQSVTETFA